MSSVPITSALNPGDYAILIVDADTAFRDETADMLSAAGYRTRGAGGAADARTAIKEFRPDVALVNVRLGRENGIDLFAELRNAQPELAGIVLAETADVDSALHALESGVHHYLRRPFGAAQILDTVRTCCVRAAAHTEHTRSEARRRALETQVRRTEKLESLGALVGGISHDFNNLLVGILGHVGLALMDLPPGHAVRSELLAIEKAALRAAALCKQMLTYSGRARCDKQPADLRSFVCGLESILRDAVGNLVALELPADVPAPLVDMDGTQMRQAIVNVVLNAAEAIGDGAGTVRLSVFPRGFDGAALTESAFREDLPEGEYICLEIVDDGCGMDPATLSRVFDPFFTTKFTGRGLGMPSVQGIMRGHGGFVTIRSTPGAGSTVRLALPARRETAAPARPAGWRASGVALIVEDDELLRAIVKQMFEHEGFEVIVASDGLQALDRFRANAARLRFVFLDLILPGLHGEDVYQEIRRHRPNLPVLVTTGWHPQDLSKVYRAEDHAVFVQKPFVPDELMSRARELIRG